MRPHTLDEMSTIILIFCRDGANKIELIEKCYLNDIENHFPRPHWLPAYCRYYLFFTLNAAFPGYTALAPSSSSILSN